MAHLQNKLRKLLNIFNSSAPTFRNGVHPHDYKQMTQELAIVRMPFVDEYILPLSQHLGSQSKPVVAVGDKVYRGQLIAAPDGFVSAALHASVTGTVKSIGPHSHASGKIVDAITLVRDPYSPQTLFREQKTVWQKLEKSDLIERIRMGGFVGLGGAAFPTHVKLSIPEGKRADFFLINAAECEPYLTSDYRIMLECASSIFEGARICMQILGARKAFIGCETNKMDAVDHLQKHKPADLDIEIVAMQTKYPQGAEKMLTEVVLNREIPSGKLPVDIEVVVNNVGTVAAIGDMFSFGQPVIERVVTITGPGIRKPANLLIPIGTKLLDVIDYCGGMHDNIRQVLFGGPMMGTSLRFLDAPIMKGTSGILFLNEKQVVHREEFPCIKCRRCVEACPVYLNPSRLGALAKARLYDEMINYHIMDCMECASCSYACPSNIPLVQRFRVSKALLREKMAREKAVAQ